MGAKDINVVDMNAACVVTSTIVELELVLDSSNNYFIPGRLVVGGYQFTRCRETYLLKSLLEW